MATGSKATAVSRLVELEVICDQLRERVADFIDDLEVTARGLQLLREYRQTAKMVVELRLKLEDRIDEDLFQEAVLDTIEAVDPDVKDRIVQALEDLGREFENL